MPPATAPNLHVGARVTAGVTLQASVTLLVLKFPLPVIVAVDVADAPGATEDGDRAVAVMSKPWKVALTAWFAFTVTAQVPVPEQPPPLHPVKVIFEPGDAVSVTFVPSEKAAVHVPGQVTPAGLLVTVPEPTTVTAKLAAVWVKVAVTN